MANSPRLSCLPCLWIMALLFSLPISAQDWSVVNKYFAPGFAANLDTLPVPGIPENERYNGVYAVRTHRHIDYFAEYKGNSKVPHRIWDRFGSTITQFIITEQKDHYLVKKQSCMLGDSVPNNWSGCEAIDSPMTMTLKQDSVMDWIDIDYLFTDYPPLPYPYPFPRLRPLRWVLDTTSPRQGWFLQWHYDQRGKLLRTNQYRWNEESIMNFKIETDKYGRDTLIQVWHEWHLKEPGKPDSITTPRHQVALHRLRYDSLGRLEFHIVNGMHDSQIPMEKQSSSFHVNFTDQVYVYDQKGRNVARVQLRPYHQGVFALTALRFDSKDRPIRKTTYLVHENRTVGEWVETMAWAYDSLGRTIRKTQYCNDPLTLQLRDRPDTQWFKWDITRW